MSIGAGWYLNQIEMREVARQIPPYIAASSSNTFTPTPILPESANWNSFMGVTEAADSPSVTQISNASGQVTQSTVTTSVNIRPFMPYVCEYSVVQ